MEIGITQSIRTKKAKIIEVSIYLQTLSNGTFQKTMTLAWLFNN